MSTPNGAAAAATRLVPIAPAVNSSATRQQNEEPELMPYTCVTCARRKVKCDKTKPCSACRKGRLDCTYQAPAPRKRKRKVVEDVNERLERYERLLKEHNLLPDREEYDDSPGTQDGNQKPDLLTPSPSAEVPTNRRTGTLLSGPGKTRYIDSNIWSELGDEIHGSSDEEDVADYGTVDMSQQLAEPLDPVTAAFWGISPQRQSAASISPPYDMALKLWEIYAQDIDPILKIVHVPTGRKLIEQAAAHPESMTKVTECLVFAIYHFAVICLTEEECEQSFGQPHAVLEKRYYQATRDALISCSFLKTTELAVLQAYMLLLMSMKSKYDPHTFWILTGVAVRLAQRMGLHRDGEELGLKPFDVQIRRRIFWQLLPLDGLASQLSGTGIAISANAWDTKQPLNINDEDIWPDMTDAPEERRGATDMIFCLARTEIGKFHQKMKPTLGHWARVWDVRDTSALEKALNELENLMEEKYIRYCDISTPIHCLTMAMARTALGSGRLRVRLPRARSESTTLGDRRELYALAKKILDLGISIHRNGTLRRFLWHLRSFFQWDPLIVVLTELRNDEPVVDPEQGWRLIGDLFASQPHMLAQRRSLDNAVARVTIKAWEHTQSRRKVPLPEPPFITDSKNFFAQREASRSNTDTSPQSSTQQPTMGDPLNMMPVQNQYNADSQAGFMNFNMPEEFTDMDWRFWEQLLPNTTSYPHVLP